MTEGLDVSIGAMTELEIPATMVVTSAATDDLAVLIGATRELEILPTTDDISPTREDSAL